MSSVPPFTAVVVDANDNPIVNASVTVDETATTTDASGITGFSVATALSHSIVVEAAGFVSETITFSGDIQTADWNNALLTRDVLTDTTLLTIYLGRLDVAPTKDVASVDLAKLAAASTDVQAALVDKLLRAPSSGAWNVYREVYYTPNAHIGQTLESKPVWLTDTKLLPPSPNPGAKGWKRYTGGPADPPADPLAAGRFFWLVNKAAPRQKGERNGPFAVAVWSPNISSSTPLTAMDMVVFFTPTTDVFASRYPFGIVPEDKDQEYMSLGGRFLLDEYCYVYELIARQRQAVFVMPTCRVGDYAPYSTGEGIFRLCREVCVFLHRECRTSDLATSTISAGVPQEQLHAGGTLRSPSVTPTFGSSFGSVPEVGRVVVGGFSNGISPVKELMTNWGLTKLFAQKFWGCPAIRDQLSEPKAEWAEAWKELWDLDGFHAETGTWPVYLNKIKTWAFDEDPGQTRMVRMCHSLSQPDFRTSKHQTWALMKAEDPGTQISTIPGAREMQAGKNTRFAVAHLDASVLDVGPELPWLGDGPHHGAPKVGFSYFSALSPVGVP